MLETDLFETCTFLLKMIGIVIRKRTIFEKFQTISTIICLSIQAIFSLMLLFNWQGTLTLSILTESLPTMALVSK